MFRTAERLRGSSAAEHTSLADPRVVRYSERPELWEKRGDLFDDVRPEYNQHDEELNYYWRLLDDVFPEWRFLLVEPVDLVESVDQVVLAEGHTVLVAWDGTDDDLGPGIDATIASAFPAPGSRRAADGGQCDERAPGWVLASDR